MSDSSLQSVDEIDLTEDMDLYSRGTLLRDIPDAEDITTVVELLMNQIEARVADVHEGLVTKMKAMDRRLDLLEQHLSELIDYMANQNRPSNNAPSDIRACQQGS